LLFINRSEIAIKSLEIMRFEVLMAVTVRIVFWDGTPYSQIFTNISEEPDASISRVEYHCLD
jgi:hypothetical protein